MGDTRRVNCCLTRELQARSVEANKAEVALGVRYATPTRLAGSVILVTKWSHDASVLVRALSVLMSMSPCLRRAPAITISV